MNNTKWREIFKNFYDMERSEDEGIRQIQIPWTTKSTNGFIYSDSTWSHFGADDGFGDIDWLKITLTPQNRDTVLGVLRKVHVSGEVFEDCVYVYGYRTDVDYIK